LGREAEALDIVPWRDARYFLESFVEIRIILEAGHGAYLARRKAQLQQLDCLGDSFVRNVLLEAETGHALEQMREMVTVHMEMFLDVLKREGVVQMLMDVADYVLDSCVVVAFESGWQHLGSDGIVDLDQQADERRLYQQVSGWMAAALMILDLVEEPRQLSLIHEPARQPVEAARLLALEVLEKRVPVMAVVAAEFRGEEQDNPFVFRIRSEIRPVHLSIVQNDHIAGMQRIAPVFDLVDDIARYQIIDFIALQHISVMLIVMRNPRQHALVGEVAVMQADACNCLVHR
jgi:hypothetical protein